MDNVGWCGVAGAGEAALPHCCLLVVRSLIPLKLKYFRSKTCHTIANTYLIVFSIVVSSTAKN